MSFKRQQQSPTVGLVADEFACTIVAFGDRNTKTSNDVKSECSLDFLSIRLKIDKRVPVFRNKREKGSHEPPSLVACGYADSSGGLMKASHEAAYRFR